METKPYSLQAPEAIAKEYGGNKQAIARAAQTGLVDPTAAVLAGMFIDRMRNAATQEQTPQQTVAQQVFAPPAPPAGLGATPQAQQMPQMPATPMDAPMAPPMAPGMAGGGLADLPVDESMIPDEYAGGGIVAFAAGDVIRAAEGKYFPKFDELQPVGADASVPGSGVSSFFRSLGGDQRRIDPETGEAVTLGEYMRRVESRRAAARTALPARTPSAGAAPDYKDFKDTDTGVNLQGLAGNLPAPAGNAPSSAPAGMTFQQFQDMQRQFGLTPASELFAADREANAKRLAELASQREENKAISMIMAGLTGMNTKNLAEFAEKAGTAGFGQYLRGEKETREERREIDKINRDLRKSEEALRRGDMEQYNTLQDRAEQRRIQLMGVEAQRDAARKPSTFQEVSSALRSSDPEVRRAAEAYLGASKTGGLTERDLLKEWNDLSIIDKKKYKDFEDYKNKILGARGSASSTSGSRTVDFSSLPR